MRRVQVVELGLLLLVLGLRLPAQVPIATAPALPKWSWSLLPRVNPRIDAGVATDVLRRRVVLFGGRDDNMGGFHEGVREWDGSTWTDVPVRTGPAARSGNVLAWDPVNQEVLLFGGSGPGAENGIWDTWTWNGTRWREWNVTPPSVPAGWNVATDPVRQVVVLFGGYRPYAYLNETWEWTGSSWIQRNPAVRPPPRVWGAMAHCGRSNRVILFGGATAIPVANDTWEWDGNIWNRVPGSASGPAARLTHGMSATSRGTVVLHGGNANNRMNDTWEWTGSQWAQLTGQGTLPPMDYCYLTEDLVNDTVLHLGWRTAQGAWHKTSLLGPNGWTTAWDETAAGGDAVAWDRARDERVMLSVFGGQRVITTILDAQGRTRRAAEPPAAAPPGGDYATFGYHEADRVSVLLYYYVSPFPGLSAMQTWRWDGQGWTQDLRPQPPPLPGTVLCYDRVRRKLVVLIRSSGDLWEYDVQSGWTRRPTANRPAPYIRVGAMDWSPVNGHLVLYGGYIQGIGDMHETWEFDGSSWSRIPIPGIDGWQRAGSMRWSDTMQAFVMAAREWVLPRYTKVRPALWLYDHGSWRPMLLEGRHEFPNIWDGPGHLIAYDRHGEIDVLWTSGGTASFMSRLRYPTIEPDRPRYRPGETVRFDVDTPTNGLGVFVPMWSLSLDGGVSLDALGLATERGATRGVLPLAPDGVFLATLGQWWLPLDSSGRGSFSWTVPLAPALVGLRLYVSGVRLAPSLAIDWIAGPRWIEVF